MGILTILHQGRNYTFSPGPDSRIISTALQASWYVCLTDLSSQMKLRKTMPCFRNCLISTIPTTPDLQLLLLLLLLLRLLVVHTPTPASYLATEIKYRSRVRS